MKTSTEEIIELIKTEIKSITDFDSLKNDTKLTDQRADSLDIAGLFLAIEEKFNMEVSDEEIESLTTINQIVEFINTK